MNQPVSSRITRSSHRTTTNSLKSSSPVKRGSPNLKAEEKLQTKKSCKCCTDDYEKESTPHGGVNANSDQIVDKNESAHHHNEGGVNKEEYDQIVFVDRLSDLKKIENDVVQLAVWRQTNIPEFATSLLDPSIAVSDLPTFEGMVRPDDVAQQMKEHLCCPYNLRSKKRCSLNDNAIDEFVYEIQELAGIFSEISQSDCVYVKLHVVEDDGCAFWHQDCVDYRMIKTYRGPCTQWVPPAFSAATLRKRRFNSKQAQSLTQGDVALFKGRGETLEDDEFLNQPGIVHRSPRIKEGSGIFRLVLVLDIPQEGWHF